jgi:transcriptional regulator with XRE-family HTH domain
MEAHDLRRRRVALGLNQTELAQRLGVARNTVWRWEAGEEPIGNPAMVSLALEALEHERRVKVVKAGPIVDQIRVVAVDELELTETAERRDFMSAFNAKVREHVGKRKPDEKLIVRVHPDGFNTHWLNMTGAIKNLSDAAQQAVEYRCNAFHDRSTLTFSFTPLDSDDDRCRLPSERR